MAKLEQRVDVQHRRCHRGLGVLRDDRHMKWQISIRIAALPATDGSPDTASDRSWMPLIVTLAHPGYPPVHPCSSGAAVRILSEYFGENTAFSMSFAWMPEVLRCFPSVSAAIEEVMNAPILGGIHFQTACNDGQAPGEAVGDCILHALLPVNGQRLGRLGLTAADDMITSRGGHPAVLLSDGKLLFLGGIVLQDSRVFFVGTSNAEIYDPASGTFAPTGPYADPNPEWDTTTLLLDGRVLLAGCAPRLPQCRAGAAELFDPQSGTFSLTGPMKAWSDTVSAAALLTDGTVLLLQATFDIPTDGAEIYDPATARFTYVGRSIGYRAFSAAVRLGDGTVLITGGQMIGGNGDHATELYLPATRTFVFAGNMITGRDSHTATLLTDGTVLIAGGISIWGSPPQLTASAEIYKPARSGP